MLGLAPHRRALLLGTLAAVLAGCAPDLTTPATDGTAHEHPYDDGHHYSWVTMHDLSVAAIDEAGAIHTWEQEGYDFPELPAEYTYTRIDGTDVSLCGLDDRGLLVCSSENDGARLVNPEGPPAVSWTNDAKGRAIWVGDDGEVRWEEGAEEPPPDDLTAAGGAVQVVGRPGDVSDGLFGCLRFATGAVSCWGGDGREGSGIVPPGEYGGVSTDLASTCVLTATGGVACWGVVRVDDFCDPDEDWEPTGAFTAVETRDHRCAIDAAGNLVCQEVYDLYCPGPGEPIAQVAPGKEQDCWVGVDGVLGCAYRVLDPVCYPEGCDYGHPQALQELWPSADGGGG